MKALATLRPWALLLLVAALACPLLCLGYGGVVGGWTATLHSVQLELSVVGEMLLSHDMYHRFQKAPLPSNT